MFDDQGNLDEKGQQTADFLTQYNNNRQITAAACQALSLAEVIEAWPLQVERGEGQESLKVQGQYRINEQSLNRLDANAFARLRIAIEWGDDTHATGIVFPDIPGAITAGDTVEQAYELAVEVAHIQLEERLNAGQPIPMPGSIEKHRNNPEFAGWGWGLVEIDITPYLGKTEKVNVTLPGTLVRRIDDYVNRHGVKSRSAFLAAAALHELNNRTRGANE